MDWDAFVPSCGTYDQWKQTDETANEADMRKEEPDPELDDNDDFEDEDDDDFDPEDEESD